MIEKKSVKGDIEKKKSTFLLIGLVIILSLVYAGFELFATADKGNNAGMADEEEVIIVEDNILNTDAPPPPPPPEPEQNRDLVLELVDDNIKVEATFDFSQDFDMDDAITEYNPVELIDDVVDDAPPVRFVEEMPEFPGGMDALQPYLKREVRYPEAARLIGMSGVVLVEFVVEKDGSISNVKVLVPVYPDLDAEAVRVIKGFPKWKPGKQMGKAVRVYFQIPIRFSIS
jgi:periplasmic protein TonB